MPTPLEVVRPHEGGCRHCVEYDLAGNRIETSGHYVCQASGCDELAEFTWAHATDDGTEPMLACEVHALPVSVRDKVHAVSCPAPDPGCVCSW